MKKTILIFICLAASQSWAVNKNAGTTGSSFLKLGMGAHSLSLANTFTAVSGESAGFFANPAGSAETTAQTIFTSASQWIEGTKYGSMAYIHPFKAKVKLRNKKTTKKSKTKPSENKKRKKFKLEGGRSNKNSIAPVRRKDTSFVVGFGAVYFDAGSMDETGIDAFDLVINKGTQVKAADQALFLNLAKPMRRCSAGLNLKYISQTLGRYSASAYGGDAGIIYHVLAGEERFYWDTGIAYHNAGTKLDFREETSYKDKLPSSIRLGNVCGKGKLKAGVDLILPADNDLCGNLGLEYQVVEGAAFRLGFKAFGYDELGDDYYFTNMTAGLGIPFYFIAGKFDYAFVPMGDLGTSHHVSLTIFFKKPEKRQNTWFGDEDM
ncbi:MAG: hypothetical protein ABII23_07575 [bacterium]